MKIVEEFELGARHRMRIAQFHDRGQLPPEAFHAGAA